MGSYFDLAAGNAALKEYYDDQKLMNLAYDDRPALVMVPKSTKATGKYIPVPNQYEDSAGASTSFQNAQQNQAPALLSEFLITLKPFYSIATLGNQAMEAGSDRTGSFIDFASLIIDSALSKAANAAGSSLFRNGTGSIGAISSIVAGVITLTNPSDITQFSINQTLQANATDGGSPLATLGWVIARNVVAGTITVSATAMGGAAGSPVGWAATNFLLVQGNNNGLFSGFNAWLPSTAPGINDNFYGVNRSVDSRLYGVNYNGSTQSVEEAIISAAMLIRREKGRPRHFVTNYGSYAALINALGARKEYVDFAADAEFGFRGVKIQGPAGAIDCFADLNCQAATGYLLQMDTWKLWSLGTVPKILRYDDGFDMLRLGNADAMECRTGFYCNLSSGAPGWSGQVALQV